VVDSFAASEGILLGMPAGGVLNSTNLCSWWDEEKRRTVETFKGECYALTIAIMSGFALSLGLDRDFFTRVHEHKSPGHTLKMIKYPKLDSQPGDGQLPRLSTHTDWGSLTFVFTEQAGLEIQDPQNHWLQVPVVPGGIIVNIGDALSLWTAKALKSTLHRITWENLPHDRDRFSMAYFSQPNNSE
jgi:isopenicillin N synthase-like dioxygenase